MNTNNIIGIYWMIFMGLCGASITAIGRYLTDIDISPFQLIFAYSFVALLVQSTMLFKTGIAIVKTDKIKIYTIRGILEFVGWSLSFYAVSLIPMPTHTALSFMTLLFLSTAAVLILKEPHNRHTWFALLLGLSGVIFIISAMDENSNRNTLFPEYGMYLAPICMFIAASCFMTCGVMIKKLTAIEKPFAITFYMSLMTSIASLPTAILYWQKLDNINEILLLIAIGCFAFLQQYSVTKAFSKAPVLLLLPFSFNRLIFSALFAYFLFDELIEIEVIIGGILILGSSIYGRYNAR